jgi:high-affinity nickel permease
MDKTKASTTIKYKVVSIEKRQSEDVADTWHFIIRRQCTTIVEAATLRYRFQTTIRHRYDKLHIAAIDYDTCLMIKAIEIIALDK